MITILFENFKHNFIHQSIYDDYINSLHLSSIPCPLCMQHHCLIRHAYYTRSIKSGVEKIHLRIQRVICNKCKSTHAILPSFIIPYSQIDTSTMISIVTSDDFTSILSDNPLLEESNLHYILRQYNTLYKTFLSNIASMTISSIIKLCFSHSSRTFMQFKKTINSLFIIPT